MSDASTKRLIEAYMEDVPAPEFLTSMATNNTFHTSEEVEIDIDRSDEDVAIVVTDLSAGARRNESSTYTSKEFKPPIYKEEATLNGFELMKRTPGQTPFVDPNYQANATARAMQVFRKMDKKIRRAVELQWSQVLQTGILSLIDDASNVQYTLDFKMKSAHKPNSSANWSASLSTKVPLTDIENLGHLLRRNGKQAPDQLIYGRTAWDNFIHNTYVQALLDKRRVDVGNITPRAAPNRGAAFEGRLTIGTNTYELWVYDVEYKDPATGNMTPYITADNVIMKSSQSRLDMSWGGFPLVAPPESRALPYLPGRMSSQSRALDIITNSYIAPDNTGVTVGAYSRPLTIPTAIDTIGCINTES